MTSSALLPQMAGFLALMLVGRWLARGGRLGVDADAASTLLTALVIDVTLPALTLDVLLERPLTARLLWVLAPTTAAFVASLGAAALAGRALRVSPGAQAAMYLCAGYANTGFLGVPLTQSLFPRDPSAVQSALLVDTVNTTVSLWTIGVALASRSGAGTSREALGSRMLEIARKPATLSVLVGVVLNLAGVRAPHALHVVLERAGSATGALVFLAVGMRLDVGAIRAQWRPLAPVVLIKLGLAPLVALVTCRALGMHGAVATVAVAQSAMPTAMMSAVLARVYRCDDVLASAAVLATLALSIPTLMFWLAQ